MHYFGIKIPHPLQKKKKKEKEKMQEGVKHLLNFDKYAKYVNSLLYF